MEPTARQLSMRGIITYGIIALALLAAVIGVVVWAKDRAKQYAANQPGSATEQTNQPEVLNDQQQQAAPAPNNEGSQSQPSNQAAPAPDTSGQPASTPSRVPATGAEEWLPLTVTISLTGFMVARYMQSRRRLVASR